MGSWKPRSVSAFKRGFKRLDHETALRAKEAIKELLSAENPLSLGRKKKGKIRDCYGYDLTKGCRIIYMVSWEQKEILFLRICSHKEAYVV